jgi:hypothetical protein
MSSAAMILVGQGPAAVSGATPPVTNGDAAALAGQDPGPGRIPR